MNPDRFVDERRTAPPVPEHHNYGRGPTADWQRHQNRPVVPQMTKDRTALCRTLFVAGLGKVEIADILGVHWAQVESVLKGEA